MEQSSMTVKLPHKLLEYSSAFMNDLTENLSVHQISTMLVAASSCKPSSSNPPAYEPSPKHTGIQA